MADPDDIGKAMEAVVSSLMDDVNQLHRNHAQAMNYWDELNCDKVGLEIFERDLEMAAARTKSLPGNRIIRLHPQKAKAHSVKVIQAHMILLARHHHPLTVEVLNTAVDSLSRPVAWRATGEIFDIVLGHVRELIVVMEGLKSAASQRAHEMSCRLHECRLLSLRLECTCSRFQHVVHSDLKGRQSPAKWRRHCARQG